MFFRKRKRIAADYIKKVFEAKNVLELDQVVRSFPDITMVGQRQHYKCIMATQQKLGYLETIEAMKA